MRKAGKKAASGGQIYQIDYLAEECSEYRDSSRRNETRNRFVISL
jgi:hypothetical protein